MLSYIDRIRRWNAYTLTAQTIAFCVIWNVSDGSWKTAFAAAALVAAVILTMNIGSCSVPGSSVAILAAFAAGIGYVVVTGFTPAIIIVGFVAACVTAMVLGMTVADTEIDGAVSTNSRWKIAALTLPAGVGVLADYLFALYHVSRSVLRRVQEWMQARKEVITPEE